MISLRQKRISRSLARSGVAILATSFTDFFAFVSGVGSAVPAIRHASVYAAFGAFFDFFYQVPLSLTVMPVVGHRIFAIFPQT